MAGLWGNHIQSKNVPVSKKEAWGYHCVGGSAINSSAFKGSFYSWDLEEISHVCPELQKLSKQHRLQTGKAQHRSAILKYKHRQKRTY